MDRFTHKSVIANGYISKIIRATDKTNGNKVILKALSLNDTQPKRLNAEVIISKSLEHKNIVKYIDAFKNDKFLILVYEYCNSGTLKQMIQFLNTETDYQIKEEKVKTIMLQLKDALKYLYENEIIHRDLKPDNILFHINSNEIVLKLADFGFSRTFNTDNINVLGNAPLIQTFCGTPVYMAPELLLSSTYNIKADLWSVGIIMYEMLYGKLPYNKLHNINDLKKNIINKQILIDEKNYSSECISLLKSLLIYDPVDRINWDLFFDHCWFTGENDSSKLFFDTQSEITQSVEKSVSKCKQNINVVTNGVQYYDITDSYVMVDFMCA